MAKSGVLLLLFCANFLSDKKLRDVSQRPLINLNLNYEKIYLFCLRYKGANYFFPHKIIYRFFLKNYKKFFCT